MPSAIVSTASGAPALSRWTCSTAPPTPWPGAPTHSSVWRVPGRWDSATAAPASSPGAVGSASRVAPSARMPLRPPWSRYAASRPGAPTTRSAQPSASTSPIATAAPKPSPRCGVPRPANSFSVSSCVRLARRHEDRAATAVPARQADDRVGAEVTVDVADRRRAVARVGAAQLRLRGRGKPQRGGKGREGGEPTCAVHASYHDPAQRKLRQPAHRAAPRETLESCARIPEARHDGRGVLGRQVLAASAQAAYPVVYSFPVGVAASVARSPARSSNRPDSNDFVLPALRRAPPPVVLVHGTFGNAVDNWLALAPLPGEPRLLRLQPRLRAAPRRALSTASARSTSRPSSSTRTSTRCSPRPARPKRTSSATPRAA